MQDTLRIEAYRVPGKPDYGPLARYLHEKIREGYAQFFADPENEKQFQEWLKKREEAKNGQTAHGN